MVESHGIYLTFQGSSKNHPIYCKFLSSSRFRAISKVCFDPADNLYLVDNEDSQIVYLDAGTHLLS